LSHWYVRKIDPQFFYPTTAKDQKQDYRKDHEWEKKIYARIKNDYYRPASELFVVFDPTKLDFADHIMIWSRIDYLMSLDEPEKMGKFLEIYKTFPYITGMSETNVLEFQEKAFKEAWGFDYDTLDKKWVSWVLKNYRNVKKRK